MARPVHYIDSIMYDIEQTARIMKLLGAQMFKNLEIDITMDEFVALDTISCNTGICQRDLASLILKDRANTGRLLDTLEEKGFITRFIDTKNNRLVKKMGITETGYKKLRNISKKVEEFINSTQDRLPDNELEKVHTVIKEYRKNLERVLESRI